MYKLMKHLPAFYQENAEFLALMLPLDDELILLSEAVRRAYDNQFLETCDTETLKRWEQFLALYGETDLAMRRRILISLRRNHGAINEQWLYDTLAALVGEGQFSCDICPDSFYVRVLIKYRAMMYCKSVYNYIRTLIPANMLLILGEYMRVWESVQTHTWGEEKEHTYHVFLHFIEE